jgi:hypothetical protein
MDCKRLSVSTQHSRHYIYATNLGPPGKDSQKICVSIFEAPYEGLPTSGELALGGSARAGAVNSTWQPAGHGRMPRPS